MSIEFGHVVIVDFFDEYLWRKEVDSRLDSDKNG